MDSLGDYLYLIIVVVAAASSVIKNLKKKQPASVPEVEEDEYEYEEIPEEVFAPKPVEKPQVKFEPTYPEASTSSQETMMSFDNTSDFSKLKAKKDIKKSVVPKSMPIKDTVPEIEGNNYSLDTVEEARAAFIASEIFNRKY